nr:MAG TPA: hypothetical protein [Caudoviricetes sp.]
MQITRNLTLNRSSVYNHEAILLFSNSVDRWRADST